MAVSKIFSSRNYRIQLVPLPSLILMEDVLYRGPCATYEAILYWCYKFSPTFANEIHCCRSTLGRKWYLDERCNFTRYQSYSL